MPYHAWVIPEQKLACIFRHHVQISGYSRHPPKNKIGAITPLIYQHHLFRTRLRCHQVRAHCIQYPHQFCLLTHIIQYQFKRFHQFHAPIRIYQIFHLFHQTRTRLSYCLQFRTKMKIIAAGVMMLQKEELCWQVEEQRGDGEKIEQNMS